MKNSGIALLVLGILVFPALVSAKPQVAVLETVLAAGMDKTVAAPITDKLIEELLNSGKYTVIDRANVEEVLREKEFQLSSGVVKNEEMRRAGEYLGADLVMVANASRVGSTYVISAKVIDVVTGEIVAQASSEQKGTIDVVLSVARVVGRQISGQSVTVEEKRAQELVREPVQQPAEEPATAAVPAAEPAGGNAAATMQMQALIRSKAHMRRSGQLQMMSLADLLSPSERLMLYSTNRKDNAVLGLLINLLIPGFGIGSFVQQDTTGALTQLGLSTVAVLFLATFDTSTSYGEPRALYYSGVLILTLDLVYMCARPFTFQREWNTNLARGLKTLSLSVLDKDATSFDVYRTERGTEWKLGVSLVRFEY